MALVFLSRFHLPVPLGSTVVTRFVATTGTLTPARLLPAPGQVSLIIERAFLDIPSPTTPCAPVLRQCSLFRAGLATDSLGVAIGGSSDFALYSQSHQSHQAVSSLCRRPFRPVGSTDYPFVSSCSPRPVARTQLLSTRGGKHRHRGTSTLQCTLILKRTSATVSVAVRRVSRRTSRSLASTGGCEGMPDMFGEMPNTARETHALPGNSHRPRTSTVNIEEPEKLLRKS